MGTLFVDKLDPQSGTALELGSSGDTVSVNTGATTNLAGNVTLGASGKTITVPSGATITNSGTATGFGESNNPSFSARLSDHQDVGDNTLTKIAFATSDFATSGTYDTSNYRFTPGVAGNYQLMIQIVGNSQDNNNLHAINVRPYKNGSAISEHVDGVTFNFSTNYPFQGALSFNVCVTANTTDYFEVYAAINDTSGTPKVNKYGTYFSGFRISSSA